VYKLVVSIAITIFLNPGMVAFLSVFKLLYYRNKLYKFQQENQWLGDPVSVFVPPGKISLKGPV